MSYFIASPKLRRLFITEDASPSFVSCRRRPEAGSGSLPASPADSGVSDVESSTSSGGNEDANLLLKARLNPNSSLQPGLASHHSHLSSGELDLYLKLRPLICLTHVFEINNKEFWLMHNCLYLLKIAY